MSASSSTPDKAEQDGGGEAEGEPGSAANGEPVSAPGTLRFTAAMLAEFDGTDPSKSVLMAYRGRVYDVSRSFMWMNGRHFWLRAGRDLTGHLHEAPHGEEMLDGVASVGVLVPEAASRNASTEADLPSGPNRKHQSRG